MFTFEVTILGCSSATPIFNRHPTSQWVTIHHTHILLDCGEGTQMQMMRFGLKASKLDHIFISHLHGDHYLGLIGLLSSMNLNGRTDELHIYGPEKLKELIHYHSAISNSDIRFPLYFHVTFPDSSEELNESILLLETKEFTIETIPLKHSIPCSGFLIKEKKPIPKVREDQLDSLTPPRALRSYAFCSDTCYLPSLRPLLWGVSTLYHETTFAHAFLSRAETTFHTTAEQAAQLAKDCDVQKLLMGHFSARYRDLNPLLEEAKAIFPASFLALEGHTFLI